MTLKLADNPDWSPEMIDKARRGELKPSCHDKTPYIEVRCECGYQMHLHRSQIEHVPEDAVLLTRCHECDTPLELECDGLLRAMNEAWGL